jgi:hypothetical protein
VEEGAPDRQLDVADAAAPGATGLALLHVNRHRDFVLAARSDAMLVDDLIRHALRPARRHAGRDDALAFRERLLGEERARKVQVAARPRAVVAERPEVLDRPLDLIDRQRLAESGHVAIESADASAFVGDRHPVGQRFDRVGGAVGEIRQRVPVGNVEADDGLRRTGAVGRVARGAGGRKDLLAGRVSGDGRARRRLGGRLFADNRGHADRGHVDDDRGPQQQLSFGEIPGDQRLVSLVTAPERAKPDTQSQLHSIDAAR